MVGLRNAASMSETRLRYLVTRSVTVRTPCVELSPQQSQSLGRALRSPSAVDQPLTLRQRLLRGRQRLAVPIGQCGGFESLADSGVELEAKTPRGVRCECGHLE